MISKISLSVLLLEPTESLSLFCTHNNLENIYDMLTNRMGFDKIQQLLILPKEDIEEIAKELQLKFSRKANFLLAIKGLKEEQDEQEHEKLKNKINIKKEKEKEIKTQLLLENKKETQNENETPSLHENEKAKQKENKKQLLVEKEKETENNTQTQKNLMKRKTINESDDNDYHYNNKRRTLNNKKTIDINSQMGAISCCSDKIIFSNNNINHNSNNNNETKNNNETNNNNDSNSNNNNNNIIQNQNPSPRELITNFITNGFSLLLWITIFFAYYYYSIKNTKIHKTTLKSKLLFLWREIIGCPQTQKQVNNADNNNNAVINNSSFNQNNINDWKVKLIIMDFVQSNRVISFEFYHELLKSRHKCNNLLKFFKEKFPCDAGNLFCTAEILVNVFVKEGSTLETKELSLLIQIYIVNLPEKIQKENQIIHEDIINKILHYDINGNYFTSNTLEQLCTKFEYQSNVNAQKQQFILLEIWKFVNGH